MWGNKKSHTPQTADPEPKNSQTNQPPKRCLFSGKPEVIRRALRGGFVRGAFPLAQLTVA